MDALNNLDPIYSVGVEVAAASSEEGMRSWHVTLVIAAAYEPLFADGYLLNGTNAVVSVSLSFVASDSWVVPMRSRIGIVSIRSDLVCPSSLG